MSKNIVTILAASIVVLVVSASAGFYAEQFKEVSDSYVAENIPSLFPTRPLISQEPSASSLTITDDQLTCETIDDCTTIPADCCDCNAGGTLTAISKKAADSLSSDIGIKCSQTACTQVLSTDWSCTSAVLNCEDSRCILKEVSIDEQLK